jgi:hypothetical protein
MHGIRVLFLCGLLLACSCTRARGVEDARSVANGTVPSRAEAVDTTKAASQTRAADTTQPLGEFEPLTRADVELYLKVMRAAAQRVKNLSAADRDALKAFRAMTTSRNPNQVPSAEQIAAIQRAVDLVSLDAVVAREMGIARRYGSISGRVTAFIEPPMGGSGDDDAPRMTAEQKAQLKLRIERFQQRRKLDAATLQPHRDEIQSLQKQVNLLLHPESIPQ